jgi:small subunit ribosomal protein S4
MGDPKRQRRKFSKPSQRWNKERIEEETILITEYGLKNKEELWRTAAVLRNFTNQAKKLIAVKTEQAKKEEIQLLNRLKALGIIHTSVVEDILGLTVRNILDRRLQSIVFKKGLAKSVKQARQFITHGHILINDKKITSPGHLLLKKDETNIGFAPRSSLFSEDHPERAKKQEKTKPKKKAKPRERNPRREKRKETRAGKR